MPYVKYNKQGYYSMSQVARECGKNLVTFWRMTKRGVLPTPFILIGKRYFYSQSDMVAIQLRIKELDKQLTN